MNIVAGTLDASSGGADENDARDGRLIPVAYGGNRTSGPLEVATAVNAHGGPHGRIDFETEPFVVAHTLRADGFDASEDGTGRGTPLVVSATPLLGGRVRSRGDQRSGPSSISRKAGDGIGRDGDPMFTLGTDSRHAVVFNATQDPVVTGPVSGALWSDGHSQAVAFDTTQITSRENRANPKPGDPCHPLTASGHPPALAHTLGVRRLTPRECERLQGFADDFTLVPWRGKPAADGPRYRAIGNSMAVPVVRGILDRLRVVDEIVRAGAEIAA